MVHLRHIAICLILSYSLISCLENNDSFCSTNEDIANVSGLQFYDFSGQKVGTYQIPNDCSLTNPFVSVYPNPAIDQIAISNGAERIDHVWLVRARCPTLCENYVPTAEQINSVLLDSDELNLSATIEFSTESFQNPDFFLIDVSTIRDDVYKIFMALNNGDIIWQNLLITDSEKAEDAINFLGNNCR